MVFIHIFDARSLSIKWNWGENLACCSSVSLVFCLNISIVAGSSYFGPSNEYIFWWRHKHWWAHVYASLMRVIIKTHYEFQIHAASPLQNIQNLFASTPIQWCCWIRMCFFPSFFSLFCCRIFCFLAQFLLHDNIIASEPRFCIQQADGLKEVEKKCRSRTKIKAWGKEGKKGNW